MLNSLIVMFTAMMGSLLLQNIVFTGGYGASEMLRLSMRPQYTLFVGGMIGFFSASLTLISRLLERYIYFLQNTTLLQKGLLYSVILLAVYCLTTAFFQFVLHLPAAYVKRCSIAAFNSLVLAVPFLNQQADASLSASLGNAIGCALAFILASVAVSAAMVSIDDDSIPEAFRGLPALLIFTGILALGFMGFTG